MNRSVIFLVTGLVIGSLLTWIIMNSQKTDQAQIHAQPKASIMHDQSMSMDQMTQSLKGKTGDDFDKTFITEMIEHHEGAIDMANEAKINAGHDEIKRMSDDIIAAQSREIDQMNQWQKDWGYKK